MTYRGHVENGQILLDDGAALPEGAVVQVSVMHDDVQSVAWPGGPSIQDRVAAIWSDVPESEWNNLPADLTDRLDHYVYGSEE